MPALIGMSMVLTTLLFCRKSSLPVPMSVLAHTVMAVPPCGFRPTNSTFFTWRCACGSFFHRIAGRGSNRITSLLPLILVASAHCSSALMSSQIQIDRPCEARIRSRSRG